MNKRDNFDEFLSWELRKTRLHPPDDGFTDTVMAALPAAKASSPWRERLIVTLPALLVGLLVLAQWPVAEMFGQLWQWFLVADLISLLKIGAGLSGATLLAGLGWLGREMELL